MSKKNSCHNKNIHEYFSRKNEEIPLLINFYEIPKKRDFFDKIAVGFQYSRDLSDSGYA